MPIQLRCFSTGVVRRLDDRWYSWYTIWTAGLHSDGRRRTWWGRIAGCRSRTRWGSHAEEEEHRRARIHDETGWHQRMASMRKDSRRDERSRSRQPLSTTAWRDWVQQLYDRTGAWTGATAKPAYSNGSRGDLDKSFSGLHPSSDTKCYGFRAVLEHISRI